MADAKRDADRIADRMAQAASALDRISKVQDRQQRDSGSQQRALVLHQDRTAAIAQKVSEMASRIRPEHAVTAMRLADAGMSIRKLVKYGSVTGGLADTAGAGFHALHMQQAAEASRRIGSALAIGEAFSGNLASAPRALEGIKEHGAEGLK